MLNEAVMAGDQATQKQDLIAPVLLILAKAELMGRPALTTQEVRLALLHTITPSQRDLEVTPSDDVSRVERQMRNLVSHRTLLDKGLVSQVRTERNKFPHLGLTLTDEGRTWLLNRWLETFQLPAEPATPDASAPRQAFESKLAELALVVIAHIESTTNKGVSTLQLREGMRRILPQINPADIEPKPNTRPSETPFDRAIRNVLSHNTLSRKGWVRRNEEGLALTALGRKEVLRKFLDLVPDPPLAPLPAEDMVPQAQPARLRM